MTFNRVSARLLFFTLLILTVIELPKKPHTEKVEVLPNHMEAVKTNQWLHANYRRGESGHLEIRVSGTYSVLECSIAGWKAQDMHFTSNLDTLADGCALAE